jgi:NAD(P)-dependent dehydrogenase (short-subunit alcohol dehydrogenase family)
MEGKFYRVKTANHPHTNMAKAAANMMTRTCAEDLARQGIYMNSVDTGWINDENPRDVAVRIAKSHNFQVRWTAYRVERTGWGRLQKLVCE